MIIFNVTCFESITGDIPLAARCLKKGARVLDYRGLIFTESSIGNMLATRDLMAHLRNIGVNTSGPKVFVKKTVPDFSSLWIPLSNQFVMASNSVT